MIRIYPKSHGCDAKAQQGYMLMHEIFDNLVFGGNLAARVPAGTSEVIIYTEDVDYVRKVTMEIWAAAVLDYTFQPDDLIGIAYV